MIDAVAYVQAWAAAVPAGTRSTVTKMQCAMASEPCGCPGDRLSTRCRGPYLQVPIEAVLRALIGGVSGVKVTTGTVWTVEKF